MCAEISVDFAVCEYDDLLEAYFCERGVRDVSPVMPDAGASYADVRELDLSAIEPMVGMPHAVVDNSVPVSQCAGTPINQAFIGSCAGGTASCTASITLS
jgi:3-isopropylmalate/(R)-2-methylmalate dehydratase large subunit